MGVPWEGNYWKELPIHVRNFQYKWGTSNINRAAHCTRNATGLRLGLTGIFPSRQRFADTLLNLSVKTHYSHYTGTTHNNNIPLLTISNKLPKKIPSLCNALSRYRGQSQSWNRVPKCLIDLKSGRLIKIQTPCLITYLAWSVVDENVQNSTSSPSMSFEHPTDLQMFSKRLALPDLEINRTHQNSILGFTTFGLIPW
jgi:hypothetical protein